ncbi:hypothetical protein FGO68_gene1042 [Halteria grandinella]|uniref:Uncharacterized protein n=1 Tax=Halteria grandinella TaxID=5974 RepID=A0A8J8NFN9_HALGN|nr:hypothetical protein FGO68_gene1042 [Halteria grandinella]
MVAFNQKSASLSSIIDLSQNVDENIGAESLKQQLSTRYQFFGFLDTAGNQEQSGKIKEGKGEKRRQLGPRMSQINVIAKQGRIFQ